MFKFIGQIRLYWWQTAVLVCIFGMTAFYASYKLSESPPTWFDEGIYIQVAQSLAEGGVQTIQTAPGVVVSTGHVTGGYPFLGPIALSFKFFGNTLFAARLPMSVFIVLSVVVTFLLSYFLFGAYDALIATFLLASFPVLYGSGKDVMGEVPGMFYTILTLCLVWKIEDTTYTKTRWWILAGLCAGLAAATKPVFFLLPIALAIIFLVRFRSWGPWRNIVWAVGAFSAPVLLWAYMQFGSTDTLLAIFQHYANPYEEVSILGTVLHNLQSFFTQSTPLYCAVLMGLWLLAVSIRVCRKETLSFAEGAALIFSILIWLSYLRTAGWYRYFFEAMVLALIFAPSSLRIIAGTVFKKISLSRYVPAVSIIFVLLGAIQVYQLNFDSWVAEHYASNQTKTFVAYFSQVPTTSVLVYDAPEIVPFLHSKNYYQYIDLDPTQTLAYGKENLALLARGVPDQVIIPPHNYEQQKNLFTKYAQTDSVGSYLVLSRQ